MHNKIHIFIIIIINTECSIVFDVFNQNGLYISDYCPEIGVCKEGTHVLCTDYNPQYNMGPQCAGVENAVMTESNADLLLDLINSIRSRAARGLAQGFEKELLPRAYGMYRVEWDPDLATLAQIWANQCIIERDNCRATKNFSDPGQLASITRYVTDKWIPLSKKDEKEFSNSSGFNKNTLVYGIKSCMRSWYNTHEMIDSEMITDKTTEWTEELLINPYLQIINGAVTHMGCGTSAFKEYRYMTGTTHLIYNVVRLVCNFSSRVYDKRGIYNVTPPTTEEFTSECGCPPGYDEDSWCLCYKKTNNRTKPCTTVHTPKKTHVVVVPIITVEDYPGAHENSRINKTIKETLKKLLNRHHRKSRRISSYEEFYQLLNLTNPTTLGLPLRKVKDYTKKEKIRKDVAPRKDFSNTKHILSNYLNKRKTIYSQKNTETSVEKHRSSLPLKTFNTKGNVMTKQKDPKERFEVNNTKQFKIKNCRKPAKEVDNNLLILINKLENEAKHMNVNEKERKVVNNEIRELYNVIKETHFFNNRRKSIYTGLNDFKGNHLNELKTEKSNKRIDFEGIKKLQISKRNFNNSNIRKAMTDNIFDTHYTESQRTAKKNKNIYDNFYLRKYVNSHNETIPLTKRLYYHNRINNIKRNLKTNDNYNNMSRLSTNTVQMRPTLEATAPQSRRKVQSQRKTTSYNSLKSSCYFLFDPALIPKNQNKTTFIDLHKFSSRKTIVLETIKPLDIYRLTSACFVNRYSVMKTLTVSIFQTIVSVMELQIYVSIVCIIINIMKYEVVARNFHDLSLDGQYGSVEKYPKHKQINYYNQYEIESSESDKAEFPVFMRRKKKNIVKNINELLSNSTRKKEETKKKNKKQRKKDKYSKKFIKTTFKDIDRDSNMSRDSENRNKPVDIIVHIKMNE